MTDPLRMIDVYLDDELDVEGIEQLAAWINVSAENAAIFADKSAIHARLIEVIDQSEILHAVEVVTSVETGSTAKAKRPHHGLIRFGKIAAALLFSAAALAIYVFVINVSDPPTPQPDVAVATLIESTGHLSTPSGRAYEGGFTQAGEYSLDSGTAEFMLTNAVNVKLRGETQMVMHNDMSVSLTQGNASFVVPANASGFSVHLPSGIRVVDLGTAFHVDVGEDGRSQIAVSKGQIEIFDSNRRLARLSARQQVTIATNGQPGAVTSAAAAVLVDHYPFNGDGVDIAGDADASAIIGEDVSFVGERDAQAIALTRSQAASRRVSIPRPEAFDPGTEGFSVAFWARQDVNSPAEWPMGVVDALKGTSVGYHVVFGVKGLAVRLDGPTTHVTASSGVMSLNRSGFRHYAVTIDRIPGDAQVRFYENGVFIKSVPIPALSESDPLTPRQDVEIGSLNGSAGLEGQLDDLRFYAGVLTPYEVIDLFEAGRVFPDDDSQSRCGDDPAQHLRKMNTRTP